MEHLNVKADEWNKWSKWQPRRKCMKGCGISKGNTIWIMQQSDMERVHTAGRIWLMKVMWYYKWSNSTEATQPEFDKVK
jgi:hypothetical protein